MDKIRFFDRYCQQERTEEVYGEKALRWIYGTRAGRITLSLLVKRAIFSRWYGKWMNQASSQTKIAPFIEQYQIDSSEFESPTDSFRSFNDFFSRKLTAQARPIANASQAVVFPADGRHLCVPDLSATQGLLVKGQMFNLNELLQDEALSRHYKDGSLLLSRLCPVDYHRFHFPCDGIPGPSRLINGPLYSVNPMALRQNIHILASNKRSITELQTKTLGKVLLLEIGATCVGSIVQTYAPNMFASKGAEKGYFQFGGSSTIVIFEKGKIKFDADLIENSTKQRELYARMGDQMAKSLVPVIPS